MCVVVSVYVLLLLMLCGVVVCCLVLLCVVWCCSCVLVSFVFCFVVGCPVLFVIWPVSFIGIVCCGLLLVLFGVVSRYCCSLLVAGCWRYCSLLGVVYCYGLLLVVVVVQYLRVLSFVAFRC